MNTVKLLEILDRRFSLSELHSLAFDCGWHVESIGTNHTVKPAFLRELIQYASRHSGLDQLMHMAANHNRILIFDGESLIERNGDRFDPVEEKPMPVDPRVTRKQEIIAGLKAKRNQAIYDALIYLMEIAP